MRCFMANESIERVSKLQQECYAVKEVILKGAENLHLTPSFLAEELIRAFEILDKHYANNIARIDSVTINPCHVWRGK